QALVQEVVDADRAGRGALQHLVLDGRTAGEEVQRQGFGAGGHEGDAVVERVRHHDGEDRPEDLLLHERRPGVRVGDDDGGEPGGGEVGAAGEGGDAAVAVEQPGQAAKMGLVDDAGRFGATGEALDLGDEPVDEGRADAPFDEDVVGGDAGLAGVDQLGPGDAAGGDVEIGVGGDDDRALASQFERHGREVAGRRGHDDPADPGAAGEEDVVEGPLEQRLRHLHPALDDGNGAGVDVAGQPLGQHAGGGGR